MNIYTKALYLPALNPLARKYKAAKARPQIKTFGRFTARTAF